MYTQDEINDGQRQINGALCYVDWYVIEAFEALLKALAKRQVLSRKELEEINGIFQKAYDVSPKVAEIVPPGCARKFLGIDLDQTDDTEVKAA